MILVGGLIEGIVEFLMRFIYRKVIKTNCLLKCFKEIVQMLNNS